MQIKIIVLKYHWHWPGKKDNRRKVSRLNYFLYVRLATYIHTKIFEHIYSHICYCCSFIKLLYCSLVLRVVLQTHTVLYVCVLIYATSWLPFNNFHYCIVSGNHFVSRLFYFFCSLFFLFDFSCGVAISNSISRVFQLAILLVFNLRSVAP